MQVNTNKTVNLWAMALGIGSFMRLARNPNRLDEVFRLSRKLATPEQLESIAVTLIERSPRAGEAFEHRPRLKCSSAPKGGLPRGSLGWEYLGFMEANHLDPKDIPDFPVQTRGDYVLAHLYETHDLWHVLTGFETDVGGELGLQAFYSAQIPSSLSSLLLSTGLLNAALFSMDDRDRRMREVVRGWQMGTEAQPLFGVDWDSHWAKPLDEVRKAFGILI